MPIDLSLLSTTLDVLNNLGDHALPARAIAREVEISYGRPLTQGDVDAILSEAKDKGWAATRTDTFGRELYHITPAGKTARASL